MTRSTAAAVAAIAKSALKAPEVETVQSMRRDAEAIRRAMIDLHGANFKVTFGSDCSFVLISRVR